jgi:transposase
VTFQKRVKACMKRDGMRVADVARWFDVAYTTAREWVLFGRQPSGPERNRQKIERRLQALEQGESR